mmetsp:Transcript_15597/g.31326  ORF Transcript_15597/g.31326 Transcript_15597/m.31326 type:complete len:87 (+) Transcript_15597:324-584(+)
MPNRVVYGGEMLSGSLPTISVMQGSSHTTQRTTKPTSTAFATKPPAHSIFSLRRVHRPWFSGGSLPVWCMLICCSLPVYTRMRPEL